MVYVLLEHTFKRSQSQNFTFPFGLADFLKDSLPLQMTEDELKKYPQFCSLLANLKERLSPDGSSIRMKSKLDTVQHNLTQSQHKWLLNHIIYFELYELLTSYDIRKQEGTLTPEEKQIQLCLTKVLAYNEIGDYLHFHPSVHSQSSLFGLSQKDIDQHNPAKHLLGELQKIIVSLLEERLLKKCDDIYNFFEPVNSSQTHLAAKVATLPDLVEQKITNLQQEREAFKKDRSVREQHFWTYYQKLLDCLSVMESIVNDYKLTCQAQADDVTVEWLVTRCDALRLKVKLTQVQVLCDTYTSETVKALKQISGHLDKAIKQSESQLTATSYSLQAYHSIGSEFTTLVNQFTQLQKEIDNRKWALSTMGRALMPADDREAAALSQAKKQMVDTETVAPNAMGPPKIHLGDTVTTAPRDLGRAQNQKQADDTENALAHKTITQSMGSLQSLVGPTTYSLASHSQFGVKHTALDLERDLREKETKKVSFKSPVSSKELTD